MHFPPHPHTLPPPQKNPKGIVCQSAWTAVVLYFVQLCAKQLLLAVFNSDQDQMDAKSIEIQEKLIASEQERVKVIHEKQTLYESFSKFREKYSKLAELKNSIQAELINSEEERLKISNLLVDTQIEVHVHVCCFPFEMLLLSIASQCW